jgi:hypothetical protein
MTLEEKMDLMIKEMTAMSKSLQGPHQMSFQKVPARRFQPARRRFTTAERNKKLVRPRGSCLGP